MATYLVTGCNRGIGLGLVNQLLQKGHQVIGSCRWLKGARELWELESEYKDRLKIIELDVTDESQIFEALQQLPPNTIIDVLINNAGVLAEYGEGLISLTVDVMENCFRVNTIGPMLVTRQCLPYLRKAKQAKIFNISSRVGSIADNSSGHAYAYRASKAALNMITKNLALEFPDWIVVALHPGWVQTDMGGAQAAIQIEESVSGLIEVMDGVSAKHSGEFLNFRFEKLPW